jgi:hypothetical protein
MSAVRRILYAAAALCLAATMQCTTHSTASGGGGIETVAVVGHARLADNSIPTDAAVFVRPAGFLAGADLQATLANASVDARGDFRLDSVAPGPYVVEVNDLSHNSGLVACSVVVSGNGTFDIGTDTIRPYASISGSVLLPSGAGANTYVQVFDLQRLVQTDSSGAYVLSNMPTGVFRLRIVGPGGDIGYRDTSNIVARSGLVTVLAAVSMFSFASEDYSSWKYSKRIVLNTTAGGANVAANVMSFPLQVRLTSANFDFSQASAGGADLRCADAQGSHLHYEIARFDKDLPAAEIWILLDTVMGNSNTQTITLYWGRPDLTDWSNGGAVFSPSLGYAAVWHLDSLADATGNGNALVNNGAIAAAGITGSGFTLNGANEYLSCGPSASLNMAASNLSIIVWEKSNDHWSTERMLFEHDVWANAGTYSFSTRNDSILSFDFPSALSEVRGWQGSNADGAWHCLAATLNDAIDTGKVYRDGVFLHADTVRSSIGSSVASCYIGCRGGVERFFKGDIDEVWVMNREISAAWLKLLYENMRENQSLFTMQ